VSKRISYVKISRLGFNEYYLNTKDKQEFYRHLGYKECEPVTSLGENANKLDSNQISAMLHLFGRGKAAMDPNLTWMMKS